MRRLLYFLAGLVAFILFLALGLYTSWQLQAKVVPPTEPTPLAEATFADGVKLEVLRAEVSQSLEQSYPGTGEVGFLMGMVTQAHTFFDDMDLKTSKKDGHYTLRHSCKRDDTPLMLLLRLSSPEKLPCFTARNWRGELHLEEANPQGLLEGDGHIGKLDPQALPARMILLEVADGGSGWRKLDGPWFCPAWHGRGTAVAENFPRRGKDLTLRATRKGMPPVQFTLSNPLAGSSFPPAYITPLPFTRVTDDYEMKVKRIQLGGHSREYEATYGEGFFSAKRIFYFEEWRDQTGNVFGRRFGDQPQQLLPGEEHAELLIKVIRSTEYEWPLKRATIIATAPDTAAPYNFTAEGTKLGVTKVSVKPLGKNGIRGQPAWEVKLEIVTTHQSVLAAYNLADLALFQDGTRSPGYTLNLPRGGHASVTGTGVSDSYTTHHIYEWEGKLEPTKRVQVGLVPQRPEEHYTLGFRAQ